MSQEQFPEPKQPASQGGNGENFTRDPSSIRDALKYVEDAAPTWVLEPTEVTVEQPSNQAKLLDSLDSMLGSQQDGDKLQQRLRGNLVIIRGMQAQPGHYGVGRLSIKAGYNINDLLPQGDDLTSKEYENLRDYSWSEREIVDDPDQSNVMVTGLLLATGAKVLRSDVGEDGGIKKIYKGMLEGKPVYFEEMILPRIRGDFDPKRETTTFLERTFSVVSEHTAKHSLNALSANDAEVLRSIGVELPALYSPDYNPDTYPNRSRMIETIRLYADMNSTAESAE